MQKKYINKNTNKQLDKQMKYKQADKQMINKNTNKQTGKPIAKQQMHK